MLSSVSASLRRENAVRCSAPLHETPDSGHGSRVVQKNVFITLVVARARNGL
jgi:hypothetical protein